MIIRLTKVSPTHHEFRIIRPGIEDEYAVLETKVFAPHDFVHYAYEHTAGISHSFFGMLAQGMSLDALSGVAQAMSNTTPDQRTEIMNTELLTGPLSSFLGGAATAKEAISGAQNVFDAYGIALPAHFTTELLEIIASNHRALIGEWQKLPFGQSMDLSWQ